MRAFNSIDKKRHKYLIFGSFLRLYTVIFWPLLSPRLLAFAIAVTQHAFYTEAEAVKSRAASAKSVVSG